MAGLKRCKDDQDGPVMESGRQQEALQPARKWHWMSSDSSNQSDTSNHNRSDSDFVEDTSDEDEVVIEFIFTYTLVYKNSCPGVGLIVGYEEDFCTGEIQNIVEEKGAAVKLMERCCVKRKDDVYKWLQVEGQAVVALVLVDSKLVILAVRCHQGMDASGLWWVQYMQSLVHTLIQRDVFPVSWYKKICPAEKGV